MGLQHQASRRAVRPNPLIGIAAVACLLVVDVLATRAVLAAEAGNQVSPAGSLLLLVTVLLLSMSALTFVLQRHLGRVHASSRPGGRRRDLESPE